MVQSLLIKLFFFIMSLSLAPSVLNTVFLSNQREFILGVCGVCNELQLEIQHFSIYWQWEISMLYLERFWKLI